MNKRICSLLLSIMLIGSFTGCSKTETKKMEPTKTTVKVEQKKEKEKVENQEKAKEETQEEIAKRIFNDWVNVSMEIDYTNYTEEHYKKEMNFYSDKILEDIKMQDLTYESTKKFYKDKQIKRKVKKIENIKTENIKTESLENYKEMIQITATVVLQHETKEKKRFCRVQINTKDKKITFYKFDED